jgi:hypothetical protein
VIAGGAPAWAVWIALGLWGLAFALFGAAFVLARRAWRQWSPNVLPLLSMFGGGHGAAGDPSTSELALEDRAGEGHETPTAE